MSKRPASKEQNWVQTLVPAIVQGLIRALVDLLLGTGGRI
jgi:hypothetical protein